ncbi:MAG: ATP synthase F1 subunit delta [Candidatus Binatia bacterium]
MIEGTLSRRYTRALFQLARESRQEETIGQEIERFLAAYTDSPLETVLNNPAFGVDSRKKILVEVARGLQLSPTSINFVSLLLERDRLTYFSSIVASYRRMLNEAKGRVEAKVAASSPLDPALVERLSMALGRISGKEVVLHKETDPALIGGMLVELEGKIYDGSVRTQLEEMKQRIARAY